MWVCGCVGVWVHGYVGMCVGAWLCECMSVWGRGCVGVWVWGVVVFCIASELYGLWLLETCKNPNHWWCYRPVSLNHPDDCADVPCSVSRRHLQCFV